MTRETKIGLLVGLAFIIVIGILLSDHMTSTTQPPQAALVNAGTNVMESVITPAPTNPGPPAVVHVPQITPTDPVLTQSELRSPVGPPAPVNPPVSQVVIQGPAAQQPSTPITIQQGQQSGPPVVVQGDPPAGHSPAAPVVAGANPPPAAIDPATPNAPRWADQLNGTAVQPSQPTVAAVAKREYVAQPGDSLSKIAARFFGTGTKANMALIVKANPTLQKNPDLVVVGRKYVIPQDSHPQPQTQVQQAQPAASTVSGGLESIPDTVPVTARQTRPIPVTELVEPLPAVSRGSEGGDWYIVKENDNLWKIAAEQLGSGNAWSQIKDLNKDILKGGETVQPNMRLRLPAKPLASAR